MKKLMITLLTSYLLFTELRAIIIEAPNLNRFEETLKTIDQQSLVLFDVVETLLLPKDLILNPYAREIWNKYAKEPIENPEILSPGKYNDQSDREASAILWRVGAKILFEEENGPDYIGTKQLNATTKRMIKETIKTESDDCAENAKIFLKKENEKIKITHYEEKSRPGIGEELHVTLLYTRPRGFCDSETLQQNFPILFQPPIAPPNIEQVADIYSAIIQPEWKFKIAEVLLGNREMGPFCLVAKLQFQGRERIFIEDKAISAGLHMTLVNFIDKSIFTKEGALDQLVKKLNDEFQGRQIKIANKNGMADLEFGISGSTWRLRAGEKIEFDENL